MMNFVLGASGQVGSAIVERLRADDAPSTAVVHAAEKAEPIEAKGVSVAVADFFDAAALQSIFRQACEDSVAFLLTPETGRSKDVLGDTRKILANYRTALEGSPVRKIVGLSSGGAQYRVGNLEMSYLLEHAFEGMDLQTIFVRPSYFYSNWLLFADSAKNTGILPTFYPPALKIPMNSPLDVAAFVANLMTQNVEGSPIYEIEGPSSYSSNEVADAFGKVLRRDVMAQQIPRDQWDDSLRQIGFTEDAVKNFVAMTGLVASGEAKMEGQGTVPVKVATTLDDYLAQAGNLSADSG